MPHKRAKRSSVKALPQNMEASTSVSASASASASALDLQSEPSKTQPGRSLFPADLRTLPRPPRVPPPPAWLRDVDVFFRRQEEACTKANAATLDATVAAARAYMARLEVQVVQARAGAAQRTELERMEVALFRWRVAATALHALDARCWGCPSSRGAHGVYANWAAVRAANDWDYLALQPPQVYNAYQLLADEKKKWEHVHRTFDDSKAPPVSAHAFFRLCAELGISAELQVEMVAAERSEGGSFFAAADQV
ncbi:hypothetical protein C8R44DRAFT_300155 [Mycena epipterygia]|nr:hypothetical protein C8R44DRAFT_300155 [Mycena epipterygia]